MKEQKFNFIRFLYLSFLTFFGSGLSPKAPGTVGSLATIPLIYLIEYLHISFQWVLFGVILLTIISCFVADYAQKQEKIHDPGWIVIDEVIGMLVTWLFVFPSTEPLTLISLFILFRFFDIVKIFPANWCDKNITSGAGTIIDDVVSALYAGIILSAGTYFHLIQ